MVISVPSRMLFIDGEWREPALKKRIPVINPATEEVIGLLISLLPSSISICSLSVLRIYHAGEMNQSVLYPSYRMRDRPVCDS